MSIALMLSSAFLWSGRMSVYALKASMRVQELRPSQKRMLKHNQKSRIQPTNTDENRSLHPDTPRSRSRHGEEKDTTTRSKTITPRRATHEPAPVTQGGRR
ncbi:hypothetical protein MA03_06355 [Infirmifilum uzonense]|uniref:Uncharacterized protein n=1 Tax=Infirmifilum uzonense TaxID=1550241 RepID=A0A0F7CL80_9CREN|nr:hypothetical protein [Infirmifilum uzonense]AKG38946.1 hypothetical protein MA03_06355 [Infirmifilum uzonense]